jgi:hypothetical protein
MSSSPGFLRQSILSALVYSDLFEYPLREDEIYQYLPTQCSMKELRDGLSGETSIDLRDGYYFLKGREATVEIRKTRENISCAAFRRAMFYGRVIGRFPFARMVALTGSLAMLNLSSNHDMDYMIVAKPGRVWMVRAFALLLGRIARLRGDVICPNIIVSENALGWEAKNLYTAREFAQMIPISGLDVYQRMLNVNAWVGEFLPNFSANLDGRVGLGVLPGPYRDQSIFEFFLNNKLGDSLEAWEMNRKIARFTKQAGYGAETNFSADVCQGNFDHHSSWVMTAYEERLKDLSILEMAE